MPLNLPEKSYRDDDDSVLKRRLLGAAVLIAVAVIVLPLVLDGSGSESRFRRVEQLRQEPPRVVDAGVQVAIPDKDKIPRPKVPVVSEEKQAPPQPAVVTEPAKLKLNTTDAEMVAKTEEPPDTDKPVTPASKETAPREAVPREAIPREAAPKAAAPAVIKADPETASDKVIESVAWVIQAGSYADETNALTLRDRLRVAGFPAFSSAAQNSGTAVYRVKVGPITNRLEAQTVQKQVESLIEQSTLIKKYP